MFSPEHVMRFVNSGDPLWELEMTIENFPLDQQRDYFHAVPEEVEWSLFKHAMRNALAVEDERPEIKSRIKAGMLLWNKYADDKIWKEADGEEYKDVSPWKKSLALRPELFADTMAKMASYENMVKQAKEFRKVLAKQRESLVQSPARKESSSSAAEAGDATSSKKQKVQ